MVTEPFIPPKDASPPRARPNSVEATPTTVVLLKTAQSSDDLPIQEVGRLTLFWKRIFDVLFSSLALIAVAPLFLVIASAVRWKSPGQVFFRQQRCGKNGTTFTCYKFRTMVPNAHVLLERNEEFRASFQRSWKLVDDPRVTPVGGFLRKTSLDELPQLWNVLKGDMSIVGPRPVVPDELQSCYADQAQVVTSVRPGMTGLWQVSGRSSLPYEERVRLDVRYVRSLSIWLDLLIVLRTMPALLGSKDAH